MGLIGKSDREEHQSAKPRKSGATTLIAGDSSVNGHLTLSDNLHIDGRVEGNIDSKADVTIGEGGRFEGEIKAENIIVCGYLDGTIDCSRLEIIATGHVSGNLVVDDLVIESGGRFIGQSQQRDSKKAMFGKDSNDKDKPKTEVKLAG